MNLNKIQIIGRITRDPELKVTPTGTKVVNLSVATNHRYKAKDSDEYVENTTFHSVVAFGNTAETIAKYFIKGQEIYVEGRQDNSSYDKDDGTKGYRSQIILETFQFGAKPKNAPTEKGDDIDFPDDLNPEDIPF